MGTRHAFETSDGTTLDLYGAEPAQAGSHPALLVFPSIFGATDELMEHADQIAASGALVWIFDAFARSGDPGGIEEGGRERAFARMGQLDLARVNADFREVLAAVKADPLCNGRVVGLGICLGGSFVFTAAADGELDGVAAWHGSRMGRVMDRAPEVRCPVMLDFGDEDPVAPPEEIEKIERACQGVISDFRIRVHPGAGHGFSHTGWKDHRPEAMAQARPDLEKMLATLR